MFAINKSLLFNAIDSTLHAINAIVDAADAIAAIAIDMVEQVFAAFEFEPQVATVQQPAIEVEIETIPPRNDQPCVYVPVICHGTGRYEVFTNKWEGEMVTAKNLTDLALKIDDDGCFDGDDDLYTAHTCSSARIAIMRAKDAIRDAVEDMRQWDPSIPRVTMAAYAIKIPR